MLCRHHFFALSFLIFGIAASPAVAQNACPAPQPLSNMTLTFDDEFTGVSLDTGKWTAVAMGGADSINNEMEAYVPSAVQMLSGGGVRLQANNSPFWTQSYTSGQIITRGHFAQAYGHFEMKAKMPDALGMWPGFWMLADNAFSWPPEIDIVEYIWAPFGNLNNPSYPSFSDVTLHWKDSTGTGQSQGFGSIGDMGGSYHTWAVDWRPGSIVWLIDGQSVACLTDDASTGQRVPSEPMYILADLAISPPSFPWTGTPQPGEAFPQNMDIAYIRGYQFNDAPAVAPRPVTIINPAISPAIAKPGDTVVISADISVGDATLPGTIASRFTIGNYDHSQAITNIDFAGPANYAANTIYHLTAPYTIPTDMAAGLYSVDVITLWDGGASYQYIPASQMPPITVVPAVTNGVCGSANGGTMATAPAANLCSSGNASAVSGQGPWSWSCAGSNGGTDASCSASLAPAACGAHASGSTYSVQISQTSGSIAATTAQCPYGGAQPVMTTVTQNYNCQNGVQTAQGAAVTATADNGNPVCNLPAACGAYASGSTYTLQISQTAGSIAATTAQCPYGGTQAVVTTTTQDYSCLNGVQTTEGAPVVTTVNNGNPVCAAAPTSPSQHKGRSSGFLAWLASLFGS